ncbi:FecR family protein [Carboxylicivirga sp. RSCT41]|uniref:FecR family protein n=1 Tax=Carboxylicivirga agarovorans TaxID=3417570 RepID=UPI003D334DBE
MIESEKIELLILRHVNGEIDEVEQKILDAWINKSEKNKIQYNKQLELFKAQAVIFTPEAIAKSRERTKTGVINHLIHKSNKVKGFIYTSLSVMLVALVASSLFFNTTISKQNDMLASAFQITAPESGPANFQLPDGSNVWLNSSSELSYQYEAESNSRVAKIEGEAFFTIAHNPNQAFLVQGYNHTVKVYGTEFNMISNKDDKTCEVTLRQGSVGLLDNQQKEVARLKPGQQFSVDQAGKATIKNIESVKLISDWTTGRYEFKDATLVEIASKLSSLYDIDIIIADETLKHKRYRCVIQKEQSVLKTLQRFSIITNLNYEVNDDSITLKSK